MRQAAAVRAAQRLPYDEGVQPIGTLVELWRYPVKSMRGERIRSGALDPQGVVGDRRYAVESTAAPVGKPLLTSRERTAMLRYQPRLQHTPEVLTPDGRRLPLPSPELLEELQKLAAPGGTLALRSSPGLPLTDVRPVSLVSTATLRAFESEWGQPLDPQRFRSNLVLAFNADQPYMEETLEGTTLQFGEDGPQIRVLERVPRCRMVSLDPDTTNADASILRQLSQHHRGRLCMYARVLRPGPLHEGSIVSCSREP